VLVEEAGELGAGVRPVGVGVGAVRDATGPGMAALVDGPALGQGRAHGVLVAGPGVGMPAGHVPSGHRSRQGARPAARAGRRQGVVDEARGVGVGHGRIPVTMEEDQRQGADRGRAACDGPCFIAANAEATSPAAA
jgi:hypothetical protein